MGKVYQNEHLIQTNFRFNKKAAIENVDDGKPYEYIPCYQNHAPRTCLRCCGMHAIKVILPSCAIYIPIHLIPILLFKRKLLMEHPKQVLLQFLKNCSLSVLFLSSYNLIFVGTLCIGTRWCKKDSELVGYASGFLAALASLFEKAERRKEFTIYCFPRVFELITNYYLKRDVISEKCIDTLVVLLFMLSSGAMMYLYQNQPKFIKTTFLSLMRRVFGVN